MGKKGDNKTIAILVLAAIIGYVLYTQSLTAPSTGTPIGETGGSPGTDVCTASQIGTTPEGTPVIGDLNCGSAFGSLESIFQGQEGVSFYTITVTATAASDTSFDNFRLTSVSIVGDGAYQGQSVGNANPFRNGDTVVTYPNSGPVSAGSSISFTTKQEVLTTQGSCVEGAVATLACDDISLGTDIRNEDWVWQASTGKCLCMLKLANIEALSDPTVIRSSVQGTRTFAGQQINATVTSDSSGYTITPDPSGAFTVTVTAST